MGIEGVFGMYTGVLLVVAVASAAERRWLLAAVSGVGAIAYCAVAIVCG